MHVMDDVLLNKIRAIYYISRNRLHFVNVLRSSSCEFAAGRVDFQLNTTRVQFF